MIILAMVIQGIICLACFTLGSYITSKATSGGKLFDKKQAGRVIVKTDVQKKQIESNKYKVKQPGNVELGNYGE